MLNRPPKLKVQNGLSKVAIGPYPLAVSLSHHDLGTVLVGSGGHEHAP
jgi:hypothetical protein